MVIVRIFTLKVFLVITIVFLKKTNSIFGNEKKRSSTIHAHNVFFYDIESRLEERFECRFQVVNSRGDCVTLRKSCMFNDMNEIEEFKHSLPGLFGNC